MCCHKSLYQNYFPFSLLFSSFVEHLTFDDNSSTYGILSSSAVVKISPPILDCPELHSPPSQLGPRCVLTVIHLVHFFHSSFCRKLPSCRQLQITTWILSLAQCIQACSSTSDAPEIASAFAAEASCLLTRIWFHKRHRSANAFGGCIRKTLSVIQIRQI